MDFYFGYVTLELAGAVYVRRLKLVLLSFVD